MTNQHLLPLLEAITRLEEAWADADSGIDLSREQLVAANAALGVLQRRIDGLHTEIAAGIAHESRVELGSAGLAKEQGFRNPAAMIAAATGGSSGDAFRLVKVGEATAPRESLLGDRLPAKYPAVRSAVCAGLISAAAAALIVALLDRARLKADPARLAEAEVILAERASGLSLDEVRKLIARAEAWIDPDGVAPREDQARGSRSLTMFERDGSLHLRLTIDVAAGASIKAAVQAYVAAAFQARQVAPHPDAIDADRRTVQMIQADAIADICAHVLGCHDDLPMAGATVVVRVDIESLAEGRGFATIDGSDNPISISSCRRMAAGGGIIPLVLGSAGDILDWGREKRLFTRAQRLALVDRDGGCAMCGLPPQMTKAHHLRWWSRDAGPTDLDNGVLLCESCHHRIHENGWDIRIDGAGVAARVWIIPPANVDPARTPRLGGRARYDVAA